MTDPARRAAGGPTRPDGASPPGGGGVAPARGGGGPTPARGGTGATPARGGGGTTPVRGGGGATPARGGGGATPARGAIVPRPDGPTPPPGGARRPPSLPGIAIVATAGLVAAWVTLGVFLPALGELGRAGQQPAALPRSLELCGGTWERGATLDGMTEDEAFARDDRVPVLVTESGRDVCPPGACTATAPGTGCAAAVYVRRGADDLVRYELVVDGS